MGIRKIGSFSKKKDRTEYSFIVLNNKYLDSCLWKKYIKFS